MFQDGESGSTAESSDEMEHADENTDIADRFHKPPQTSFPTSSEDRTQREELGYAVKPTNCPNSFETSPQKTSNSNNNSDKQNKSESNVNPISQITNILSSRNVVMNNLPAVTTSSPTAFNSSLPLMVPNNLTSANLSVNISPSSVSVTSPNQFQALPLLVQTPGGVGYASTPDGMVLALLQGANISQPQLVALPTSSIGQALPKNEPIDKSP